MRRVVLLVLFISFASYAGLVEFSGSASLYGEYDKIDGDTLIDPTSQVRFSVSPTISIAEMPITFDFQLSTLESKYRQALNKYRISIQPEKMLRDKINLPSFVFTISNVEFGTCYPYFSPYTLSGVPVTGGVVELNPWILHLEGTKGQLQRSVDWSDTTFTDYAYQRELTALSVGFGRKETSHFHFIYLHSGDDSASVDPLFLPAYSDSDSVEVIKPMENYVVGIDFKWDFPQEGFYIESEIVGTEVTRDIRMPELTYEDVPSILTDLFRPRLSSAFDFAFTINSGLNIYDTEIFGSVGMAGPGFESFGNPYLRNDFLGYEAGIKQNLFNNSMFLYGSLSNDKDNLLGMKGSTTAFSSYELGVGFNFTNLPYLDFSFMPYKEVNDSLGLDRNSNMYSVNTGYDFNFSDITNYISFFFSFQDYEDTYVENNYTAKAYSISDEVSLTIPLSLSFAMDYSESSFPDYKETITTYDVGAYYTFFDNWTNGVGVSFSSGSDNVSGNSIYLNSSLYVGRFMDLGLDIERNVYVGEFEYEDYNEWRIIGSVTSNW
jgi:hypothetical protein